MILKRYIFVLILLIGLNENINSCTCIGSESLREAYLRSDLVVKGTIVYKEKIDIKYLSIPTLNYFMYKYSMVVDTAYNPESTYKKGDTLLVISGTGTGDCGFDFKVNNEYIVYGVWFESDWGKMNEQVLEGADDEKYLYTDICRRTKRVTEEELQLLVTFLSKYYKWWKFWRYF